jgi:uncharacterized protein
VALPSSVDVSPGTRPGSANARPLAGPVIPLTVSSGGGDELLGGARPSARPATLDPLAVRVLTKGEAIAAPSGRADDFSWPRGSGNAASLAVEAPATASRTVPDPPPAAAAPAPAVKPTTAKPAAAGATALRADADAPADDKPKPKRRAPDPTPQPFNPFGGIFR